MKTICIDPRKICIALMAAVAVAGFPQANYQNAARPADRPDVPPTALQIEKEILTPDSITFPEAAEPVDTVMSFEPLPRILSMPAVYTKYKMLDTWDPFSPELKGETGMDWIERSAAVDNRTARMMQHFMLYNPGLVKYNIATMERPPREFYGTVNPSDHTIEIREVAIEAPKEFEVEVQKRHWLRTFNASLQFSQAYISPNWYQGGNNNLNIIANIFYNVKLNPTYHPNLLFESTMQYKLGVNSAPDDSLRNYSISEDLLQLNATFGYKAARKWYYSVTAQFKTQVMTSYVSNTRNMASAFLSPGEFTAGLGMTYNHANAQKTFTFDASIAPLSYNMKICIKPDDVLAHATYGIDPDKKYVMNFGSSAEAKLMWKITDNITFRSRVFVFTNYDYLQADWENTLGMDINRYLTTQIYVHARYDTSTPPCSNPDWHKLQLKEILSFGVAYKFSTI